MKPQYINDSTHPYIFTIYIYSKYINMYIYICIYLYIYIYIYIWVGTVCSYYMEFDEMCSKTSGNQGNATSSSPKIMPSVCTRVVESESVESHVFSWSRSRFSNLLESESVFSKLLESESVFQNCWSRSQESEHLLQLPTPMFIK